MGQFRIELEQSALRIFHVNEPERALWQTCLDAEALQFARGDAQVTESRGFFQVDEAPPRWIANGPLLDIAATDTELSITGHLSDTDTWSLEFRAIDEVQLSIHAACSNPDMNRILVTFDRDDDADIFGFGEQFTHLNMRGRRVPVLSQEPGIGRGVQPLTWIMNTAFKAGGDWHNSNAPMPWYMSTNLQGVCLENHQYNVFDFTSEHRTQIYVHAAELRGRLFYGSTPLDLISAFTRFSGRMRALPQWVGQGAIIGMQGGTNAVKARAAALRAVDAPVAAFWLQDWVGARKTSVGWQLWWNWELDHERYPGWAQMVAELRADNVRIMTYLNPFLVNAKEKGSHRRNLFAEALEKNFLIRKDTAPYLIKNTSFSAALLDLANPDACAWIKEVIKTELIASGASGWMADFGEALPFDADLHDDIDAAEFHNAYPEEWARVNREAIQEAGLDDEVVFFMRSGYTRSARYNTLFWMGDQLTSWRQEDGIKSTVTALLSSGISGQSLNHSDIGGYTATTIPWLPFSIPGVGYTRSKELLHRWIELNAFTPVYRTHEGNQPDRHFQIDGDDATLKHFARFARIFAALSEYRQTLIEDAAEYGHPVVRHPWLHYPHDARTRGLEHQFLLGPDIMVAPVLDAGRQSVRIYLPEGTWMHLWSDEEVCCADGQWIHVSSPPGAPAVFLRGGSSVCATLPGRIDESDDRVDVRTTGHIPWCTPVPNASH